MAPLVLVVDDDRDIRDVLAEVLAFEGYAVISAMHGAEALDLLREWHADLIILDLMMPVMDGHAFLAAKRRDPAIFEIPVLAVTAATQLPVEGATVFMRKPFQLDSFLMEVARCIAGARLRQRA
jgi:CheY-like chemotaxis protein